MYCIYIVTILYNVGTQCSNSPAEAGRPAVGLILGRRVVGLGPGKVGPGG